MFDDTQALSHLLYTDNGPVKTISVASERYFKVKIIIAGVRALFAEVPVKPGSPEVSSGCSPFYSLFCSKNSDSFCAGFEQAVFHNQLVVFAEAGRKIIKEVLNKHIPIRQTASFYDVLPPTKPRKLHPPGEWNSSRVVVRGAHVEHWLNGEKVLEYELESDELKAAIAASKFKDAKGFGTRTKGHLMLTDHGDECWFRNVRLRELPAQ